MSYHGYMTPAPRRLHSVDFGACVEPRGVDETLIYHLGGPEQLAEYRSKAPTPPEATQAGVAEPTPSQEEQRGLAPRRGRGDGGGGRTHIF